MHELTIPALRWTTGRKLLFRFCFILFLFIAAPWQWPADVPGISRLSDLYDTAIDRLVSAVNSAVLHIRPVLVPVNGSGDTSFGWAALWTYVLIAATGMLIWTALDRKRPNYIRLNYWLCVMLRYYVALTALSYGIAKLFLTQMVFPNNSELATPLGDYLPMRLSWMFIGYSAPYQFLSGVLECLAGLLLLYRRTATLGAMLAAGVFVNVAMLNLSYDIPVKIFSLQMVAITLYLLAAEWDRISCFFFQNRPAPASSLYEYPLRRRWMRVTRLALKVCFLVLAIGMATWNTAGLHAYYNKAEHEALPPAVYDVKAFNVNGQPAAADDTRRWENVALDGKHSGSIKTEDTTFEAHYGRRYFVYYVDTAKRTMEFRRFDDSSVATMSYHLPDSSGILLSGRFRGDSLVVMLSRSPHRFPLADRPFHWLSEANR